jgi:signal peptidase I
MIDASFRSVRKPLQHLPRPLRIAMDWAVTILGAVAVVFVLRTWIVTPYRIPTSSMEPTLHCARPNTGCRAHFADRLLACRACYWFSAPARGDIVVFTAPAHACGVGGTFVKRLIGLPGDRVVERRGRVYVDGKRLDETYVDPNDRDEASGTWHVGAGRYFLMGDNRVDSCDSRQWGTITRRSIIGKAVFIYWPPNRIAVP